METYGRVLSVDTRNAGEPTTAAAALGATVVNVLDAATFDEAGGQVSIGGTVYPYLTTNVTTDTLILLATLKAAVDEGALVEVYPPTPEKVALVELGGGGDAIPVLIPHALVEGFPEGIRDYEDQETVIVDDESTTITDVVGEPLTAAAIDADRLAVGVAGNLVQDPQLTTATAEAPWQIGGPDPAYPEFRFARCSSRSPLTTLYSVTDRVPVEEGQSIRFSAPGPLRPRRRVLPVRRIGSRLLLRRSRGRTIRRHRRPHTRRPHPGGVVDRRRELHRSRGCRVDPGTLPCGRPNDRRYRLCSAHRPGSVEPGPLHLVRRG